MKNWYAVVPLAAVVLTSACSDAPTALQKGRTPPQVLAAQVTGGSFTTVDATALGCQNGTGETNCNLYTGKDKVYLSGGPIAAAFGLSGVGGRFVFTVLVPGYQNPAVLADGTNGNLSDNVASVDQHSSSATNTGGGDARPCRIFDISTAGDITYPATGGSNPTDCTGYTQHVVGSHLGDGKPIIQLLPYDNTTNNGGGYILAVCRLTSGGTPDDCKYDYFKVRETICTTDCGPLGNPEMAGMKYYDADRSGYFNTGDTPIPGWQINVSLTGSSTVLSTLTTGAVGEFDFIGIAPNSYHFAERQPNALPNSLAWVQTGNTPPGGAGAQFIDLFNVTTLNADMTYDVLTAGDGNTTGLNFGNVCRSLPGGHTLGFWSNKNGQALETAADFTALTAFSLRSATGANVDFTGSLSANRTALSNFLLSANATNMANMLSAQMTATYLSVQHGFTDGSAPVDFTVSPARTVNQLITYANSLLAANGVTIGASAARTEQERVKNLLDAVNNNASFWLTYTQAQSYCPISFAPTTT